MYVLVPVDSILTCAVCMYMCRAAAVAQKGENCSMPNLCQPHHFLTVLQYQLLLALPSLCQLLNSQLTLSHRLIQLFAKKAKTDLKYKYEERVPRSVKLVYTFNQKNRNKS